MAQRGDLTQAVVDQEDLQQERGAAKELHVGFRDPPQRPECAAGGGGNEYGQYKAYREGERGQLKRQRQARQELTEHVR